MAQRAILRCVQGFLRDKDIVLKPDDKLEITFGRDRRNSIPIMNRKVSRKHAKVTYKNGQYTITDLESKAGTKVNRHKVTNSVLRRDDLVEIGPFKFKFVLEDADKPKTGAVPAALPPMQSVVIAPKLSPPPEPVEAPKQKEPSSVTEGPVFTDEELAWVGRTVKGIRIISAIGRGRRTVVYKGIQSAENRVVAFKILNSRFAANPDVNQWFMEGARKAGEQRHEELVPLLGGGREGAQLFIFTLFMDLGDARRQFARIPAEGAPGVKRALEAVVHITRALEYAKGKNILHQGIRPSKILFGEKSKPKLNGLGFDNSIYAPGAERTIEIESYVAPEVIAGGQYSVGADIYGLGATFYYMLASRRPQRDPRKRLQNPKELNPSIPDSICRIVEKMTAPDPAERYPSHGQLLHDLRWALRGEAWPH